MRIRTLGSTMYNRETRDLDPFILYLRNVINHAKTCRMKKILTVDLFGTSTV